MYCAVWCLLDVSSWRLAQPISPSSGALILACLFFVDPAFDTVEDARPPSVTTIPTPSADSSLRIRTIYLRCWWLTLCNAVVMKLSNLRS